jgi:ribonuclease HII
MAIVKGDRISISIAAASILAKVYRDHKMRLLGRKYPQYGFGRHKGYGTRGHREAIIRHRVTRLHRVLFVKTLIGKMGLDFKKLSVTMAQDEDILN